MTGTRIVPVEHNGKTYELQTKPITRLARNQAMEIAAMEGHKKLGEPRPLPSVMERELAVFCIKGGLPKATAIWWVENEDYALGDKIAEATGIKAAIESLGAPEKAQEVVDAKNLSAQGDSATEPALMSS